MAVVDVHEAPAFLALETQEPSLRAAQHILRSTLHIAEQTQKPVKTTKGFLRVTEVVRTPSIPLCPEDLSSPGSIDCAQLEVSTTSYYGTKLFSRVLGNARIMNN